MVSRADSSTSSTWAVLPPGCIPASSTAILCEQVIHLSCKLWPSIWSLEGFMNNAEKYKIDKNSLSFLFKFNLILFSFELENQ